MQYLRFAWRPMGGVGVQASSGVRFACALLPDDRKSIKKQNHVVWQACQQHRIKGQSGFSGDMRPFYHKSHRSVLYAPGASVSLLEQTQQAAFCYLPDYLVPLRAMGQAVISQTLQV